jgi:hypothetical protein
MDMLFGLSLLAGSLLLLVLVYRWWWHRLLRQTPTVLPAVQASVSEVEQLESAIGGELPKALKNAYLDGSVTRIALPTKFERQGHEHVVDRFFRLDAQAKDRLVEWDEIPEAAFIFAEDDFGNYYFVKANDNAIYYWDHDGGDITKVFEAAEEFWNLVQVNPETA